MRARVTAALAVVVLVGLAGGALVHRLTTGPERTDPRAESPLSSPEPEQPADGDGRRAGSLEVFASKDPFAPAGESAAPGDDAIRIEMIGSEEDSARFRIGSGAGAREVEAATGKIFESYLQLLAVEDGCAVLLYGDEQFSLCPGDVALR